MTANELWNWLVEQGIATDEELRLVTDIAGHSIGTLNGVIFSRTGYRDYDQMKDEC